MYSKSLPEKEDTCEKDCPMDICALLIFFTVTSGSSHSANAPLFVHQIILC